MQHSKERMLFIRGSFGARSETGYRGAFFEMSGQQRNQYSLHCRKLAVNKKRQNPVEDSAKN